MSQETSTLDVKLLQPLHRKKPTQGKGCIKTSTCMAFAEYETVSVGPTWLVRPQTKDCSIENSKDIST
jgi:hypothetical protein